MKRNVFLFGLCCLTLASCVTTNPNIQRFSAINPVTEGGITTFKIAQEQCSNVDYGDGRGESDCRNGNMRSQIQPPKITVPSDAIYDFKVRIRDDLNYAGFYNLHYTAHKFLKDVNYHDSRLRIATWEGEFIHNYILNLKLDSKRGITFLSKVCIPPADLNAWNHIQLKIKWRGDESGSIEM